MAVQQDGIHHTGIFAKGRTVVVMALSVVVADEAADDPAAPGENDLGLLFLRHRRRCSHDAHNTASAAAATQQQPQEGKGKERRRRRGRAGRSAAGGEFVFEGFAVAEDGGGVDLAIVEDAVASGAAVGAVVDAGFDLLSTGVAAVVARVDGRGADQRRDAGAAVLSVDAINACGSAVAVDARNAGGALSAVFAIDAVVAVGAIVTSSAVADGVAAVDLDDAEHAVSVVVAAAADDDAAEGAVSDSSIVDANDDGGDIVAADKHRRADLVVGQDAIAVSVDADVDALAAGGAVIAEANNAAAQDRIEKTSADVDGADIAGAVGDARTALIAHDDAAVDGDAVTSVDGVA